MSFCRASLFVPRTKKIALSAVRYGMILGLLIVGWAIAHETHILVESSFGHESGGNITLLTIFEVIIFTVFGFFAYELAKNTVIPSFVLAIFIGMLQRTILSPLVENPAILNALTTIGAAFILFGGGLDTPFSRFRKNITPILSIAVLGTIITAWLFSAGLFYVSSSVGMAIPIVVIVLIGAALASTDPAAIIPSLKSLFFPNPRVKDIAISESAINDIVGAVLTTVFLSIALTLGSDVTNMGEMYSHLIRSETGLKVLTELLIGTVVGVAGFLVLHAWSKWKGRIGEGGGEADAALFLAVPLLCYLIAVSLHGSGFLAVFIAGLLFQLEDHISHVEHYFVHTIEGFMKPLIFMLLGASVDLPALLSVTKVGLVVGTLFILVIRPIAVFLTLTPFVWGKHKFQLRELVFLSFVRETGVIPAVLLMSLAASQLPGSEVIVPIGLWVILMTLIIQPPLTPLFARWLGVAKNMPSITYRKRKDATAVLCSRGLSFKERLPKVVEWADIHGIQSITLLHCPEDKYSEDYISSIKNEADQEFAKYLKKRATDSLPEMDFEFLCRPGSLQDNIEELVRSDNISIIFVGSKMLDYRMEDVKRLSVPFIFLP